MNCHGELFSQYTFEKGSYKYETSFQKDVRALLQIENFYYKNELVAQQISAGRLKQEGNS